MNGVVSAIFATAHSPRAASCLQLTSEPPTRHGPASKHAARGIRPARSHSAAAVGPSSRAVTLSKAAVAVGRGRVGQGGRYRPLPAGASKSHGSKGDRAAIVPLPRTNVQRAGTRKRAPLPAGAVLVLSHVLTVQQVARSTARRSGGCTASTSAPRPSKASWRVPCVAGSITWTAMSKHDARNEHTP